MAESITGFFTRLGFPLRNDRTSWGAVNGNAVLLRTWEDQYSARTGRVQVFGWLGGKTGTSSTGWNERQAHLRLLWQGGYAAYTVIVQPGEKEKNGVRQIRDFREDVIFPIEKVVQEGDLIYAIINKIGVPVGRLTEHRKIHRVQPNETPLSNLLIDTRPREPDDPKQKLAYKAEAMRAYLIEVAARGAPATVTYGQLFDAFDLNRLTIPPVLALVGHQCQENGEPILTALVVLQETGRCSGGLDREFGVDEDEERRRVYGYWSHGSGGPQARNGLEWTEQELAATALAYRDMYVKLQANVPFVKSRYYEQLSQQFDRYDGAYERRMQNFSAVLDELGLPWLPGLKPQANIGARMRPLLLRCLQDFIAELRAPITLPEEVPASAKLTEGAKHQITVNAYERDSTAKSRCLKRWGTSCVVCGFSFGAVYGQLGDGFIHVHHLRPLSTIGEAYELDPEEDLRPVCPNCHAMLHREKEVLTIQDLRAIIGLDGEDVVGDAQG
ncbi:HNH endonuclease [Achromobacter mucicolens]|uniref:HNH endonuclease n=1 Tax=Achromobacter mucicolens TaxID=1389922 RepID=UPI003B992F06